MGVLEVKDRFLLPIKGGLLGTIFEFEFKTRTSGLLHEFKRKEITDLKTSKGTKKQGTVGRDEVSASKAMSHALDEPE